MIGDFGGSSLGYFYNMKMWFHVCTSWDLTTGKLKQSYDGKNIEFQTNPFDHEVEKLNERIKEPFLVTDALFGCVLTEHGKSQDHFCS